MSGRIVLGVDGGGTKTNAAIFREDGTVLARGTFGSSNRHSNPPEAVRAVLTGLAESLLHDAGIEAKDLSAACLGMAGCDSEPDRRAIEEAIRPALAPATRLLVANDAVVAMRALLGRLHGMLLIAGTGSICLGFNERTGETARCGGWGHLLADEGSGYAIGLAAMRAVVQQADGRGQKTSLTDRVLSRLGLAEPRGLLGFVYGEAGTKTNVAALSRLVIEECEKGDGVAALILRIEAGRLCALVPPVWRKLFGGEQERERGQELGLWGGNLTQSDHYRAKVEAGIAEFDLPIRTVTSKDADAVIGAARHALAECQ
ncbi:hypothetical protein HZA57_08405 [Candidatus Poribacteria bacterium]|nr:hypothetical protein [Candidatus Poribacteria bacterium]